MQLMLLKGSAPFKPTHAIQKRRLVTVKADEKEPGFAYCVAFKVVMLLSVMY